jgi:hypothetical protein
VLARLAVGNPLLITDVTRIDGVSLSRVGE